jgi:hypothetical protein
MVLTLWFVVGGGRVGELRCGAPVSAGKASLPASLLSAIKARLSPTKPIPGAWLRIYAGDQREVTVADTSYVFELFTATSTDFAEIPTATLD